MAKYDFLIVGSGLYGATCAHELTKKGYRCLVLERRSHIGGNVYTENIEGINVHKYGAHIFHTSDREIWDYVNGFAQFNRFVNQPIARYHDECYNLPFNMNTFSKLWRDVFTPEEAQKKIEEERRASYSSEPKNLEEQAINLVGKTIYEKEMWIIFVCTLVIFVAAYVVNQVVRTKTHTLFAAPALHKKGSSAKKDAK